MSYSLLKSFEELAKVNLSRKAETLFVFDMDLVVSIPVDPAFHPLSFYRFQEQLKPLFSPLNPYEEELVFSLLAAETERQLVEQCFISLVNEIFAAGHKAIILTAQFALNWNGMDFVEQRVDEVRRFQLDFQQSFPHIPAFHFHEWTPILGAVPVYKDGVIFSHTEFNSKGDVLKAFLQKIDHLPNSVVYVDDKEKNVVSVQNAMASLGIPCEGWHYQGIFECEVPSVEEATVLKKWGEKVIQAVAIAKNLL